MANLAKHGDFSMEAADKEEQELRSAGGQFLTLKVGTNVVRILPPPPGASLPWVKVYEHYFERPGEKRAARFACPRVMAKQQCPLCAKADELMRSGNPADRDRAWDFRPKIRGYMNVIDRKEPEKGVQILASGKTILEKLVKLRKNEVSGGNFTDVEKGFDIVIERDGTGKKDTDYDVFAARKITPLGNPEWLEQTHDLSRFATVRSQEDIYEMVTGQRVLPGREVDVTPSQRGAAEPARQPRRTAQDDVEDAS